MKNMLSTTVLLLLLATTSIAGGSPKDTVLEYCQKDFDGIRLSSKTWQQVVPLITWEHEAGWDSVTGVSAFELTSEEISGNQATVQVQFTDKFGSLGERINFNLREEDGRWKIVSPVYQPHVSQALLCERDNICEAELAKEKIAIQATEHFLRLVDQGLYDQSWDEASSLFVSRISEAEWERTISSVRPAFGNPINRSLKSSEYRKSAPGAPDGEYVIVLFSTSFEHKKSALETVTAMLDKDGVWRVAGYFIR